MSSNQSSADDNQNRNRTEFADGLIALGQHLKLYPGLPKIAHIGDTYLTHDLKCVNGLSIQSYGGDRELVMWARTLTDVSSAAKRLKSTGDVYGYVYGRIAGVRVEVWAGSLPSDGFPAEPGVCVWDISVQLQEA